MARSRDPLAPQPEPAPTRSDSAEIVEAIVAAVIAIGDPNVSINTIAERAGVGIASVYRYFPNKSAIYAEISRRLQRDFLAGLRTKLADPSLSLEAAVEACCRMAVVVPGVTPALRQAVNTTFPLSWSHAHADAVFSSAISEMTQWLGTRLDPVPRDLADRVFIAFASGRGLVMMSMLMPDRAPPHEVLIRHMVRATLLHLRDL